MSRFFFATILMLFYANVSAEWRILPENNTIESVGYGATVRVQCSGELTVLAVSMGKTFTTITPDVDGNPIEMAGGKTSGNLWLYVVSAAGIQQLITGHRLDIRGTNTLNDGAYGYISLIGFSNAYKDAKLAC